MRKGKIIHIGNCVEKFLSKNSFNSDGYALRVFFSKFIGPKLSKYAQLVKFSPKGSDPLRAKDTVYISVKSPVVKNEIMLLRRKIIKGLNEFLGSSKIKNLKIIQE